MKKFWLASLCLLLFSATAQAGVTPFTWQLKVGKVTHYFTGSVHLLPSQAGQLPAGLQKALAQSQVLVFESDIAALSDPEVQMGMLPAMQNPEGIQAEIGAPLYQRLQKQLAGNGMPSMLCDSFRAWACSMSVEVLVFMKQGFRSDLGVDQQLYQQGKAQGKTLDWFESLDQHLGLLTTMTPDLSRELLESTLDELEKGEASPQQLLDLWQSNDVAGLGKMLDEMKREQPRAYERLLSGRNRAWMAKLEKLLRGDKPALIVVGAAHYAGRDGLIALLKARGFELKPVSE